MSAPPQATAAGYFGAMIESYDSLIRRAVPRYEDITAALVGYLPSRAHHVLELGCGTGNLSLALAARYPYSSFVFADASPEMVELTRQRVETLSPDSVRQSAFVVARFEELELEPRQYDLVTSSFSLHHVRDKGALFAHIHAALRQGGTSALRTSFEVHRRRTTGSTGSAGSPSAVSQATAPRRRSPACSPMQAPTITTRPSRSTSRCWSGRDSPGSTAFGAMVCGAWLPR
jgi:ubiquinone/menaquinone biosynthesis C-methylase UbiE